jgi:uncharacterized membrane protein YeaQ/YmgE (transglycosylase-associated protein family)
MSIIAWIILGALAGIIAEKITGSSFGLLISTLIGIVGALLGGFLAKALFGVDSLDNFFDISTWLTAIIGSIIVLVVWRKVTGSPSRHGHRLG